MSQYGLDVVLQSSVILKSRDLLGQLSYHVGRDALHHSRRDAIIKHRDSILRVFLYVRYARENTF
jgi:hypothetical protein